MTQDVRSGQQPEATKLLTAKHVAEVLAEEFGGEARRSANGNWTTLCPCHDDNTNSLSLKAGERYNVTGKCHAGCKWDDVREALAARTLLVKQPRKQRFEEAGQYDYHDAERAYVFTKVKLLDTTKQEKTFRVQVRDETVTAGYRSGLPDGLKEIPLYNLLALLAAPPEAPVFIVEGEKDCDTLRARQCLAVSNYDGGGGEWRPEYVRWLTGRELIVIPDNDKTGREHAATVVKAMAGQATSVRVVALPGVGEHGDVSDWFELEGNDLEALQVLVEAAEAVTAESYETPWRDGLLTTDRGGLLNVDTNYYLMLSHHDEMRGRIRFNAFANTVELDGKPLAEEVSPYDVQCWLQRQGLPGEKVKTWDAIQRVSRANAYDPLTDYVRGLRWDGVERLGTWLHDYCGAGSQEGGDSVEYLALVGRRWMVGAIKRWIEPGSKVEQMLILEGEQGAGKSAMVRALAPQEGWFVDDIPPIETQYKDAVIALQGHCLVEVAEMAAIRKSTRESVKKFLSVQQDKIRKPYGRDYVTLPRRCVFVGTHNSDGEGYLTDPTGNRRYLPVTVTAGIDLDGIRRDRDQLWAEAYSLYKGGEQHWLDASDVGVLDAQRARYKASELGDLIWQYVEFEPDATPAVDSRDEPVVTWAERADPLDLFIPKYFWQDVGRGDWLRANYRDKAEVNGILQNAGWKDFRGREPAFAEAHGDHPRLVLRGWRRQKFGDTPKGPRSVTTTSETKDHTEQSSTFGDTHGETSENRGGVATSVAKVSPSEITSAALGSYLVGDTGDTSLEKRVLEVDNGYIEDQQGIGTAPGNFSGDKCHHSLSRLRGFVAAHRQHPIGCDIETTSLRPEQGRARLLQLFREGDGVVVDLDEVGGLSALRDELDGLTLVAFNAQFEYQWFRAAGVDGVQWEDAKLAYAAIFGGGSNLKELVLRFLGKERDKGLQRSDWSGELSDEQIAYALEDAEDAWRLWQVLVPLMEEHDAIDGYATLMEAIPAIARMQSRGMRFDLKAHAAMIEQWERESESALEELEALAPEVENWNSPSQISAWLKQHLPLTVRRGWPRTTSGQYGTGKDAVRDMLTRDDLPKRVREVLEAYAKRQQTANYLKTFGRSLAEQVQPDGRLYGSLQIGAAITGRMSSSSPNLQNMPTKHGFRGLFVAEPGHALVVADYSQIEVRVGGLLADEPEIRRITEAGVDVHTGSASLMYHKPVEEVTALERKVAKGVTFGMQYGMGTKALAKLLGMSVDEAERVQTNWLAKYPMIAKWRAEQEQAGKSKLELRTAGGRRIQLPPRSSPSVCYNYPVQGSAGDVMYRALHYLEQALEGKEGVHPLTVVHDEVVLEVEQDKVEEAKAMLEQAMVMGFLDVFPEGDTTGLVDATAGPSWAAKG